MLGAAPTENEGRAWYMSRIIEVEGLKKSYGPIEAVKGIDFFVEEGTLFAFLGPTPASPLPLISSAPYFCRMLEK